VDGTGSGSCSIEGFGISGERVITHLFIHRYFSFVLVYCIKRNWELNYRITQWAQNGQERRALRAQNTDANCVYFIPSQTVVHSYL
jgi:hypothetical protein